MKRIVILLILLSSIPLSSASISFINQTPDNNSITGKNNIFVNVSVTNEPINSTVLLNWNRSLVLWARMNEAAGGTLVEDFSGHGNNGTWIGYTTSNITIGRFGNGLILDGINDYVLTSSNDNSLNFTTGNFTLIGWIKTTGTSQPLITKKIDESNGAGYRFGIRASGRTFADLGNGSAQKLTTDDGVLVNDNVLHQLALVVNSTHIIRYVDGLQDGSVDTRTINNVSTTASFWIGRRPTGYCNCAVIDEILAYNRDLSSVEIATNYNASRYPYLDINLSDLTSGYTYSAIAYSQDTTGNINQTETRFMTPLNYDIDLGSLKSPHNFILNLSGNFTNDIALNVDLSTNTISSTHTSPVRNITHGVNYTSPYLELWTKGDEVPGTESVIVTFNFSNNPINLSLYRNISYKMNVSSYNMKIGLYALRLVNLSNLSELDVVWNPNPDARYISSLEMEENIIDAFSLANATNQNTTGLRQIQIQLTKYTNKSFGVTNLDWGTNFGYVEFIRVHNISSNYKIYTSTDKTVWTKIKDSVLLVNGSDPHRNLTISKEDIYSFLNISNFRYIRINNTYTNGSLNFDNVYQLNTSCINNFDASVPIWHSMIDETSLMMDTPSDGTNLTGTVNFSLNSACFNNVRVTRNGGVVLNYNNGIINNVTGWNLIYDSVGLTANLSMILGTEHDYIFIDYSPENTTTKTGLFDLSDHYGALPRLNETHALKYINKSGFDYFIYEVLPYTQINTSFISTLKNNNVNIILYLDVWDAFWPRPYTGYPNVTWMNISPNSPTYNADNYSTAYSWYNSTINTVGESNIYAVSIGGEEPDRGFGEGWFSDHPAINNSIYVNGTNTLYNALKANHSTLRIFQNGLFRHVDEANLDDMLADGYIDDYYYYIEDMRGNIRIKGDYLNTKSGGEYYMIIWNNVETSILPPIYTENIFKYAKGYIENIPYFSGGTPSYELYFEYLNPYDDCWGTDCSLIYEKFGLYREIGYKMISLYSTTNLSGLYCCNLNNTIYPSGSIEYSKYNHGKTNVNATINSSNHVFINFTANNNNLISFIAINSTAGQIINITVNNSNFTVTDGVSYRIKKDGVIQQANVASGDSVTFTNIAVGSTYDIEEVLGTVNIEVPANTWAMFNNWTSNETFSQIAANESNDLAYSYYNTSTDEWDSYFVGYSYNAGVSLTNYTSVVGFFNAATTITVTPVTPSNTALVEGWNMAYLMGSVNKSLSTIKANLTDNGCDPWMLYEYNTTSNDYSDVATNNIQPNAGFIVYVNATCTWARATI